ncbi:MAG: hypothetical protein ACI9F9_003164 [Candidatus Paceibacteria bacterium]|jgi:hypothetical protein
MRAPLFLLALLSALCACSGLQASKPVLSVDQTQHDATSSLEALTLCAGEWHVIQDSEAPSGGHALAQVAQGVSADFNLVLLADSMLQDVDVAVSMRSVAGEIDQGGGIVWRAQDARNYYVARYNPLEDNYRVYTVVDGVRTQLKSTKVEHSGGWHRLRITMSEDLIHCYYDGELALEVTDSTFAEAGKLGLWTKADAQTLFNSFE